ncbi:heterokaryon incompatibility protein-domain-containing protein, partial [Massariosphaeria phaeospora]
MSTALLATRPPVPLSLYSDLDPQADEIRLLLLSPAPCTVPTVSCELLTVSLKDRPIYDALSYVWGDPKITRPIRVNGQVAQVTVNLEAALRRIQQPDYQVRVWVDAVCVNQRDESERSSQVAFMKEIYSNARMVYAWLGEEGER